MPACRHNVWAQWGSGKPKIVIVTEIDALPEGSQDPLSFPRKPLTQGAPGHMKGHNTHGAALMTGTTMDMEFVASAWPQLGNKVMAEAIQKNIDAVGLPKWSDDEVKFAKDFQASLGL